MLGNKQILVFLYFELQLILGKILSEDILQDDPAYLLVYPTFFLSVED